MHTTNYFNAFIEVADDCPIKAAEIPPVKGDKKTVANIQFDMIIHHPYKYTSDDVIFQVYSEKNEVKGKAAREAFFSKGQACLRTSPLTKRYGWGVHSDDKGRVALYPMESKEYKVFSKDKSLEHTKGMRSKKA